MNYKYEYIEDNGGGLHLFIFNRAGRVIDGITNLEYAQKGEWSNVKDELNKNARDAASGWEGHMRDNDIDAQNFYNTLQSSEYGYEVVCKNGVLYQDVMGRAAQIYFGVEQD